MQYLVYNGQTGRSINTWLKEYHWYIWLQNPDNAAMVQHISLGYHIQLRITSIVTVKHRYMYHIRERLRLSHPNDMNRLSPPP
jgi:hypothetical protein